MFCTLYIIICCCQKFTYHTFNVIANITCLSKRSGVRNGKRYIQKSCQSFHHIGLTTSCRSNHKHIRFFNFHIIRHIRKNTLIMVIYPYRHHFFCMLLSNNIFIQTGLNFMRSWNTFNIKNLGCYLFFGLFLFFLNLLFLRNLILKRGQINHADIGHVWNIPHQFIIINVTVIHSIKTSLHTICTDMDIPWQLNHLPSFTLRASAHKADFFIFVLLFFFLILRRIGSIGCL